MHSYVCFCSLYRYTYLVLTGECWNFASPMVSPMKHVHQFYNFFFYIVQYKWMNTSCNKTIREAKRQCRTKSKIVLNQNTEEISFARTIQTFGRGTTEEKLVKQYHPVTITYTVCSFLSCIRQSSLVAFQNSKISSWHQCWWEWLYSYSTRQPTKYLKTSLLDARSV